MADLKISQLTLDTLGASDFVPIQRSTSNYKLNLKTAIQSCLGTMAVETAADYLAKSGNLSGLADASIARTNLGLGTTDAPRFTQLTLDVADNSGEGLSLGVSSWKIGRGLSSVLIYPPSASAKYAFRTTGLSIASGNIIAFTNDSDANSGSDDVILARKSAANLRHGAADAASPVAQYDSVQNVSTGTSNTAGVARYIDGSQGTGTGAGGSIIFRTAAAGSSGSSQNALVAALTIDTAQNITFAALLKLVGTTSSYPALKRNSTGVDIRLADDSDYAPLAASTITANGTFVVTSAAINAQTGTTYTLQSSDNGKIITLTNASAITLTVPASLPVGFSCQVIQGGAGQVTFSASSTTINSYGSLLSLAGQYASASLISNTTDVFVLAGNLI